MDFQGKSHFVKLDYNNALERAKAKLRQPGSYPAVPEDSFTDAYCAGLVRNKENIISPPTAVVVTGQVADSKVTGESAGDASTNSSRGSSRGCAKQTLKFTSACDDIKNSENVESVVEVEDENKERN